MVYWICLPYTCSKFIISNDFSLITSHGGCIKVLMLSILSIMTDNNERVCIYKLVSSSRRS